MPRMIASRSNLENPIPAWLSQEEPESAVAQANQILADPRLGHFAQSPMHRTIRGASLILLKILARNSGVNNRGGCLARQKSPILAYLHMP